MSVAEQPFDDREKRYFLAEILKVSSIAPSDLFSLIQNKGIIPHWTEIALPNGRSLSACTKTYDLLANNSSGFLAPFQPVGAFEQRQPQRTTKPKKKQSSSNTIQADRTIQPVETPNLSSINAPTDPNASINPSTHQAVPALSLGKPTKKRGRPSKAEYEIKAAEAAARGEVWPLPRKKKTQRPSMEGASNTGVVTPLMTEAGDGGENFTVEKPKIVPAARMVVSEHPGRNPYLEATAHAADQMQIDTERLGKNTIPETQASEYPASDNFLAGMREHAGQIGPDTAQSSLTLVQDSGQPLHLKESPESADPAPEIRTPGLPATGQQ